MTTSGRTAAGTSGCSSRRGGRGAVGVPPLVRLTVLLDARCPCASDD